MSAGVHECVCERAYMKAWVVGAYVRACAYVRVCVRVCVRERERGRGRGREREREDMTSKRRRPQVVRKRPRGLN